MRPDGNFNLYPITISKGVATFAGETYGKPARRAA
jgi:hypothetical protein